MCHMGHARQIHDVASVSPATDRITVKHNSSKGLLKAKNVARLEVFPPDSSLSHFGMWRFIMFHFNLVVYTLAATTVL